MRTRPIRHWTTSIARSSGHSNRSTANRSRVFAKRALRPDSAPGRAAIDLAAARRRGSECAFQSRADRPSAGPRLGIAGVSPHGAFSREATPRWFAFGRPAIRQQAKDRPPVGRATPHARFARPPLPEPAGTRCRRKARLAHHAEIGVCTAVRSRAAVRPGCGTARGRPTTSSSFGPVARIGLSRRLGTSESEVGCRIRPEYPGRVIMVRSLTTNSRFKSAQRSSRQAHLRAASRLYLHFIADPVCAAISYVSHAPWLQGLFML
jgi:hypothetical protein